ncbi:hypothetical protein SLOPH_2238 [Spraguea lophii 42_110]|uniref:Uncharacterized protein n=1 Tax=Spraguea lophii (strain 42_110) TaxID=1358809 RepID=S7XLQ8_SPRLO|nr:hypothetical protein SLOPH_2238 [Spraguea lophii 42_110]
MFFLYLGLARLKKCSTDADCWGVSRGDIHSMFCVENKCQNLIPSGGRCERPTDCASYFYYGPLACSAKCKSTTGCGVGEIIGKNGIYCCRSVPEGGECLENRPNYLSGCDAKTSCLMNSNGYTCNSGNGDKWILGVLLSVSGNLMINLGVNFQKKSYRVDTMVVFGFTISTFSFGMFIYIFGKFFGFFSYVYGNQSLLASLSGVGLLFNSVFAPLINNETFTWKDFAGIICILTGSAIIVKNSGHSTHVYTLCELLKLYESRNTIVWFSFLILLIILLFFLLKNFEINSDWRLSDDFFMFLKRDIHYEESNLFRYSMLLFYDVLAATIASFSSLFAKSFGEMLDQTVKGENQFLTGITYIFLTLIVICTVLQIYWINRALRHYDALIVVPIFHMTWTLLSITTAGIYFHDFENFTANQYQGFITGIIIIFSGSCFLAGRIMNKDVVEVEEVEIERSIISKKKSS